MSDDFTPTFQRWGDWKGSRPSEPAERWPGDEGIEQGPYGALDHIDAVRKADMSARVYLGGLGKMINQEENDREIRGYLDGFNIGSPLTRPQGQGAETTITALSISKAQRQRKKPSRQSVAESFLEAGYGFEWLEDFRQVLWTNPKHASERALYQGSGM
ncbi:hypothetical protein INS49_009197 [Diaporthe citri]|uniref:uncharacterized protein n=1 Tax=Diaporthe citri TaxID=83186 RepID=UPI001C7EFE2C|nr:uncharacterized protein INS49_009197 [Diaporthe citri]KAG6360978.1 hypothetical protein INS49_009197 [Diaporthe citri]